MQPDQKDAQVSRGGFKVGQPLSETVRVIEADLERHRYKIKKQDGQITWCPVSKLTSLTHAEEKSRSKKGTFVTSGKFRHFKLVQL